MNIIQANESEAQLISDIISISNKDIADRFGLTLENCSKHPSFCCVDWVTADMVRGVKYFILKVDGKNIGCVAYESPDAKTAYLNRLSVLPQFRNKKYGVELVKYHVNYARTSGKEVVSIGIIAAHNELKEWYEHIGFVEQGVQSFEYLPFEVMYMSYQIENNLGV